MHLSIKEDLLYPLRDWLLRLHLRIKRFRERGLRNSLRDRWQAWLTRWVVARAAPALEDPMKRALVRITLEGLAPPDTVSMGVANGGPAVFFKHDGGKEVFIGRDYEHAADCFLGWIREQQSMGEGYAPTTKETTSLSRHERRAYASKKFRNKQKTVRGTR